MLIICTASKQAQGPALGPIKIDALKMPGIKIQNKNLIHAYMVPHGKPYNALL